ncbi:DUF192 domain-containing protein [Ruegeria aquimaris]|uniref:DUF192 domain-containing protein n=1 Tax=Ruegeria aquimaris TaxID=2984333 RepID=A0ABT3AMP3_9RHOB|nr:DUF192 domain-containing protein [Ruegeria sp. XHP0148]MCV2889924.1 DUF192 domain-containing protein [Ruegeria sp. XHP0148]
MLRAALFFLAIILSAPAFALEACRDDVVFVQGEETELRFSIEVAATQQDRSRGLMFREHLPRSAGMLFVFERPQRVAFWMKNTLIPLDMIFVDQFGEVTRVHSNAIPHDETAIPGGDDVFAVLEINGGLAASYGISAGARLRHPVFLQGSAVWPC